MARKKLKWSDMRPSEKRDHVIYLIGQILKWLFVGSMCIFTLYPVVYTLLGSFKTNAELTLGGNFLPENWQFNNYVYAFQKLDFGKYFLNIYTDHLFHGGLCDQPPRFCGQKADLYGISAQYVHLGWFGGAVSSVYSHEPAGTDQEYGGSGTDAYRRPSG